MTTVPEEAAPRAAASSDARIRVTLVHGTFARNAPWIDPERSRLCRHLVAAFGDRVEFDAVPWSGENNLAARLDGSHELLALCRGKQDVQRFLIGHSHGGNVIAYALREDRALADAIAGVVFMSTPFVHAGRRNEFASILLALRRIIALGLYVLAMAIAMSAFLLSSAYQWEYGLGVFFGVLLACVPPCWWLYRWSGERLKVRDGKLPGALEDQLRRTIDRFDLSALAQRGVNRKTLVLRMCGDEASSTLGSGQLASWVLGRGPAILSRLPQRIGAIVQGWIDRAPAAVERLMADPRRSLGVRLSMLLAFLAMFIGGNAVLWLGDGAWGDRMPVVHLLHDIASNFLNAVALTAIWGGAAMLAIALVLAFLALAPIALVARAFFGEWLWHAALLVQLSTEPTPPGRWQVEQLSMPVDAGPVDGLHDFDLAHSAVYEDDRALERIAQWMKERLAAEAPSARLPPH